MAMYDLNIARGIKKNSHLPVAPQYEVYPSNAWSGALKLQQKTTHNKT